MTETVWQGNVLAGNQTWTTRVVLRDNNYWVEYLDGTNTEWVVVTPECPNSLNVVEDTLYQALKAKKPTRAFEIPLERKVPTSGEPLARWFQYAHLPERLQQVSMVFADCLARVLDMCPATAERTVALRKLLESKDAAVRSILEAEPSSS